MIKRPTNKHITANHFLFVSSTFQLFCELVQSFNKGRGYNQHVNSPLWSPYHMLVQQVTLAGWSSSSCSTDSELYLRVVSSPVSYAHWYFQSGQACTTIKLGVFSSLCRPFPRFVTICRRTFRIIRVVWTNHLTSELHKSNHSRKSKLIQQSLFFFTANRAMNSVQSLFSYRKSSDRYCSTPY